MLILVSAPEVISGEVLSLIKMFDEDLRIFHLRKPGFDELMMKSYLAHIPHEFHSRIVLHSNYALCRDFDLMGIHLTEKSKKLKSTEEVLKNNANKNISASLHDLESLNLSENKYDYIFLSPIFDSISKPGHQGAFNLDDLKIFLSNRKQQGIHNTKVIALGGVNEKNIELAREAGFDGVALLGAIWENPDPVREFIKIRNLYRVQFKSFE